MPNLKHSAGLNDDQVAESRRLNGSNSIESKSIHPLLKVLSSLIQEPMLILLLASGSLYFVTGQHREGYVMLFVVQ